MTNQNTCCYITSKQFNIYIGIQNKKEGRTKMFYAKDYNFAYCSIPKTGCSNFKKILWLLNGKVSNVSEISKFVSNLIPFLIETILKFLNRIRRKILKIPQAIVINLKKGFVEFFEV